MESLNKVKEHMKSYSKLDDAVQEIDDMESNREEKTNFDLFQEEGIDVHAIPSYYQNQEDDDEDGFTDEESAEVSSEDRKSAVEGYEDEEADDYVDDEVPVVFTSNWKQPELESSGDGKTLLLTVPEGLTTEQRTQWNATIKALVQSAKYWNIAECTVEDIDQGIMMKERQMTPDVYKGTPVKAAPPSSPEAPSDVWALCGKTKTFPARKAGVTPLVVTLEELFSSRGEFISVGGHGKMSLKEAIILGLRHKRLYNQARVKYNLV
ncbi:phosphoprotein [Cocal virus]|uniref:Phosphoprotein n=1 Tax=Cocal virus TaxID=50713 RepID=B3FRK7_COCAV|nr:phosphoprotein [Cocal virus]ACB47435.1 phosphoprotein [Cocal virus]